MSLKQLKVDQLIANNSSAHTPLSKLRSNRLVDWDLEAALEASLKDDNKPDWILEATIKASQKMSITLTASEMRIISMGRLVFLTMISTVG
jgi:hypothetical protein